MTFNHYHMGSNPISLILKILAHGIAYTTNSNIHKGEEIYYEHMNKKNKLDLNYKTKYFI